MQIVFDPLSYHDRLDSRNLRQISMVVVHATELPDLEAARSVAEQQRYEASRTGNSGHYYIGRDGRVLQWVADDRVAHHVRGYNLNSLGVELSNLGRYPHWLDSAYQRPSEPFLAAQIDALIALLQWLKGRLPNLKHIAGHDDLDRSEVPASDDPSVLVRRKVDPGPLFPWPRVLSEGGLSRFSLDAL